ncbi:hypothetical protein MUS1_02215 [Marinomonas ushuaiensis DSM 15871]|uniref:DUF112 domain-containing protein n=1 Tax=Marinomonas ushuaiensis DSM 15871 TaxID=1122207 RepID=X7E9D2_9GAMM|nr:tripartite tricarboxylate transporter permease [Marinomonas ushuaiensis]ETX12430.1 hypothetical protein MUS1_02215 [Marinomonas ushuaiensis DSM 15871]
MDMFSAFISSFSTILQPEVLGYMISGFLIGTFFGAMPGLTSVLAIALLLPITYSLDVVSALVMCSSIFMAGMYSGSITAITINIPGAPSSVMTAVEGNALMKKGYGANALGHAALGSMVGGVIGVLLLVFLAPLTAKLSLYIQTPGKFSLILFSLIVIIISHKGFITRAAIASLMGIMIASIGIDVMQPISRFDYGTEALMEGIEMMPLIIGVFAISEIIYQTQVGKLHLNIDDDAKKIRRRDFFPKISEIKAIGFWTYLKSSIIGYMVGVLPGAGGSVAAFISYADAKRKSKKQQEYGSGSREGIAAAESANNSMCGGAFVPMLVFGIPGDPTTAIVLGVLMINGLQPGVRLLENQVDLIAPMFASLFISALILIPLTLFILGPYFIKIVSIKRSILYPCIAVVAIVGSYVATYSMFQMSMAIVFGLIAFLMRANNYPTVPLLLGYVLGPGLEQYFRRSMSLNDGNPSIFITNLDSLFFILLTFVFVYFLVIKKEKRN